MTQPLRLGLLGQGIVHSLSPALHTRLLALAGLQGAYVRFDTADPQPPLAALAAGDLHGLNVTTPYKPIAAQHCALSWRAGQVIEQPPDVPVNTLWRLDNRLVGASTDGPGLVAALHHAGAHLPGARVLVLGAGGAAHAVIPELQREVASVTVCARRDEEAARIARLTGAAWTPWGRDPGPCDIVVHLTRWGHGQLPSAQQETPWSWLPWSTWRDQPPLLLDAVYTHSGPTCFEALAITQQVQSVAVGGGRWMLAAQAAASFALWTGHTVAWQQLLTVIEASPSP